MKVTKTDVVKGLLDIVRAYPWNSNPRFDSGCLYTDPKNPQRHCLAGEFAAQSGWSLPAGDAPENFDGVYESTRTYGWPLTADAEEELTHWQGEADAATKSKRRWGSLRPALEERLAELKAGE